MDMQAVALQVTSRTMANVQSEIGMKVFRMALDAEASTASVLLNAANSASGVGQNINTVG